MAQSEKEFKVRITLTPEQRAQIKEVAGTEFEWVEVSIEEHLDAEQLEERIAPKVVFN